MFPLDSFEMSIFSPPRSVLIIGSGIFGLGTAQALARRPEFRDTIITVVDRSDDPDLFPSRDASSIDTSRIIRADYSDPAYAALAAEAQVEWRKQGPNDLGGEGRYTESGLVIVAGKPATDFPKQQTAKKSGMDYIKDSWDNIISLARDNPELKDKIQVLQDPEAIREAVGTGGTSGDWGYINRSSGWADADASMRWFYERVRRTDRVCFKSGTVISLRRQDQRITGAELSDGRTLEADLVVLCAGAWSGSLVDLAGQATATGQILAYMDVSEEEQDQLARMPVLLNLTTGLFIIPPAHGVLKIAHHGYGYLNPTTAARPLRTHPGSAAEDLIVSVPLTCLDRPDLSIPAGGSDLLRSALCEMTPLPSLLDRQFTHTRLCWYSDTPTGDFLIDYHPQWDGLFVATGDSGHGFKFLPVIGERIVDCIMHKRPAEFREKWAWKQRASSSWHTVTEDGSRGGLPGLNLLEELSK